VSAPGGVLDAETIQAYLREVADELPDSGSRQHVLVLVGGALLAWAGLRGTTRDVDSIHPLDQQLRTAVASIAARHDLAPGWVNDSAAGFAPRTLREEDCTRLWEHPRLLVLAAPWRDVFLMKLQAARDVDWDDLVALWPRSGFTDASQAVSQFHEAYPHEAVDPYLIEYVERVAKLAASP